MRTVFRAFFVENGCSLITLVGNRVEKYCLLPSKEGDLQPSKLWIAKIKHCTNIVEAPEAKRLVATDTSGKHYGMCIKTGQILWQSNSMGEGDPGVIIRDQSKMFGSQEVFVFATWSGVLQQIDAESGKEAEKPVKYNSQFRGLQLTSDGRHLFVTRLVPAKSDNDPVGETLNILDISGNNLREVSLNTFSSGICVSPDRKNGLFAYIVKSESGVAFEYSERWVVKDIRTGLKICERTFEPREIISRNAVWSPDGQQIATANNTGHLILSADTLSTVMSVAGQRAERPAFHPSGKYICLCRANNTKIVTIS